MTQNNLNALWAKKPQTNNSEQAILSLPEHLNKTATVSVELYHKWIPKNLQTQIPQHIFTFLACAHDLGKASPIFQTQQGCNADADNKILNDLKNAGYTQLDISKQNRRETRHELISHAILKRHGFDDSVCVIVGGHHGLPPTKTQLNSICSYEKQCGFNNPSWIQAQDALLDMALATASLTKDAIATIKITRPMQVIISGLVILADWIASSEADVSCLPSMWQPQIPKNIYMDRFCIPTPRPVQSKIVDATDAAGIFIIEAPMGEGKTEAALAAAEILASKAGCRGVYFALPSQATSNAMLTRVKDWINSFTGQEGALSIRLSHGKAGLNDEYEGIKLSINDDDSAVTVNEWLTGRKKGMLADFTIGTIDHVLMAGLKQKHLALRHLGLATKVLIIDECHAYDVYMESYLLKTLKWLGAYGVPVVILSATLPTERRRSLVAAYLNKSKIGIGEEWATSLKYPLITYTAEKDVHTLPVEPSARSQNVSIHKLEESELISALKKALTNGGYAGVICNTVKKAQSFYQQIKEAFSGTPVELLHSGFVFTDRAKKESDLIAKLGKSAKNRTGTRIVVGTQIFEQSLDIDFDVMFTELCPMDLLLQRIGRLHRHDRPTRPAGLQMPSCHVIGTDLDTLDKGSAAVYGECLLMRTCTALPSSIALPQDIPLLVAQVYDESKVILPPSEYAELYTNAVEKMKDAREKRTNRAENYQIKGGINDKTIIGLLETIKKDSEGEAAVRDGTDSIEVLLIQRRGGKLHFLPWINGGAELPYHTPTDKQAKDIARCAVRLPQAMCYNISETITDIEKLMLEAGIVDAWYESYWLSGELVLILDERQCAELDKYRLRYDERIGMVVE